MNRAVAVLADLACVAVFVWLGRRAHDDAAAATTTYVQVFTPFAIGAVTGSLAGAGAHVRPQGWVAGLLVAGASLGLGMALRGAVFGGGVQPSFLVVAGTFLFGSMLGWRAVAGLVQRRSARPRLTAGEAARG